MGLSIQLHAVVETEVYSASITHNLGRMASAAGIYQHLWRPEEIEIKRAGELVEPLRNAIAQMNADPDRFRMFDAENGWGTFEQFLPWLERCLAACEKHPEARIWVSR